MKFKIHVTDGTEDWWEEYDKETVDPDEWGRSIIEFFNSTLRPGEKPRTFLGSEVIDADNGKFHNWEKRLDGMSRVFRGHVVDIFYCTRCGITGKRYGFGPEPKHDAKFRKKVFQRCDTALAEMTRKKEDWE